jgi:hypothetical protein
LPEGKTPFEILYGRRPDLSRLKEWGSKVWVHATKGTKLDERAKAGRWMGFDDATNGHHVYWPDKCSISIERSVKFCSNGDILLPQISSAQQIQGENNNNGQVNQLTNLQCSETKSESSQPTKEQENTLDVKEFPAQDFTNHKDQPDQWLETPFNCITDELVAARSCQVRIPSCYIRDI